MTYKLKTKKQNVRIFLLLLLILRLELHRLLVLKTIYILQEKLLRYQRLYEIFIA